MELEWDEPPEEVVLRSRGAGGRYLEVALALRSHPDRWALLPSSEHIKTEKSAKSTAQNIRRGNLKGFTAGEYDAVTDGSKIWVKYLPPEHHRVVDEPKDDGGDPDAQPLAPDTPAARTLAPRIREWAKSRGISVPERGRIQQSVMDQFFEETGEERPRGLRVVKS